MNTESPASQTLNTAFAHGPLHGPLGPQSILSRIFGSCRPVLESGDLHAFSRDRGALGLYVLDTSTGNLFFEPLSAEANLADSEQLASLERSLFERQMKLAGLQATSWTLEDGYAHLGDAVEPLVAGLDPTVEIFNLARTNAAVPLSQVQPIARFVVHRELPIIALSQPLHSSECEPRQWNIATAAASRRAG